MKRWILAIVITIVLVGALGAWLASPILKALPSRYVARLPEPIQALGVREHVDVLPTAAVASESSMLLFAMTPEPTASPPPTTTPHPTDAPANPTAESGDVSAEPLLRASPTPSATPPVTPVLIPQAARIANVQHRFQEWNNCGPATLAMALSVFGLNIGQQVTAAVLKPNPEDRNVSPAEMVAYVENETELDAIARSNGTLDTARRLLAQGMPVIVEVGLDPPGEYTWMGWYGHYLLLVAYDDAQEQFWVYDSWFGTSEVPGENADDAGRSISYSDMDNYWRQFNRSYIVLYEPEEATQLAEILGPDMQDSVMWQAALDTVRKELQEELDDAFLWFNLGTVYNALGDYEQAAMAYDQARSLGLPWRMLWYQFGPYEAYYQVGRYEDVVTLADVTLQDRPYFEESYYYRGLALAALGQTREARNSLQQAVDFNPGFSPAALALADLN